MQKKARSIRLVRWILSIVLIVTGLSVTWAWGQVARLAEPQPMDAEPGPPTLYASWQPAGALQEGLFRSTDNGGTWQSLTLPEGRLPIVWADDGGDLLAVALDDDSLLYSADRGDSWTVAAVKLPILSLVWGNEGDLYLGTDSQGVYRLLDDGELVAISGIQGELAQAPVQHLALSGQRLFAATPTVLFYTDDGGGTLHNSPGWTKSLPVPGWISAMVVVDPETIYIGTETVGVYRSTDAGQTWQPALAGLGLAAGQMVKVTALQADPREPGVLYAAIGHVLGSTHVHFSAEGVFVTLDGGASWRPLAGATFPDAVLVSDLVVVPDRSLYVQAVTANGLQGYEPDLVAALAMLQDADPQARMTAARILGLAQAREAGELLLSALADPVPAVGLAAADALGRIADPATAGSLLVVLEHPDEQVRLRAAKALGMMGVEGAVEPLRTMLLNGDGAAVTVAAEALGRIGSPAATEALLAALSDRGVTSRRHAALATLEAMGEKSVGPVTGMLDSRDGYVRRNAAQALGWIGSPAATSALIEALGDRSAAVREQVAWALGEIGDPAARTALERAQARDSSLAVQAAATAALARIEEQPVAAARWPVSWAPALGRLQLVRWLVLGLSLAGAAWLAVGNTRLAPIPLVRRASRR